MKYFKFNCNPVKEKIKNKNIITKLLKKLRNVLFSANPDYDDTIPFVANWYIEYDDSTFNMAIREIGTDENNNVIMKMPYKRNYGYWSDTNLQYEDYKKFNIEIISKEMFIEMWNNTP